MRQTCENWIPLLTVALVVFAVTPPTAADVITIDFTGLNLEFADGDIYDADHLAGGNGLVAEATALGSITFYKNYEYVISLDSDVYADILVQGVPGIPENGYVGTSGGLFVDLLSSSGTLLGLPVGALTVSYMNFSGIQSVWVSGIATGAITQNLPGELVIDPGSEITILLTGDAIFNPVFDGDDLLVGFGSNGTGQIEGTAIPEPGSLMILLSLAVSALAVRAWRVASMKARCL